MATSDNSQQSESWTAPENLSDYNDADISVAADEMLQMGVDASPPPEKPAETESKGDAPAKTDGEAAPPAEEKKAEGEEKPAILDLAEIARQRKAAREKRSATPPAAEPAAAPTPADVEAIVAKRLQELQVKQMDMTAQLAAFERNPAEWYKTSGRDPTKALQGFVDQTAEHKGGQTSREVEALRKQIEDLTSNLETKATEAATAAEKAQDLQDQRAEAEGERQARSRFTELAVSKGDDGNHRYELLAPQNEHVLEMLSTAAAISLRQLKVDRGEDPSFTFDEVADISNNTLKQIFAAAERSEGQTTNSSKTLTNDMTTGGGTYDPSEMTDDDVSDLADRMLIEG